MKEFMEVWNDAREEAVRDMAFYNSVWRFVEMVSPFVLAFVLCGVAWAWRDIIVWMGGCE